MSVNVEIYVIQVILSVVNFNIKRISSVNHNLSIKINFFNILSRNALQTWML